MLDLDSIFNSKEPMKSNEIDSGLSLIDDLQKWIDKFNIYLVKSNSSKSTLATYYYALKSLNEYSKRYLTHKRGLSELTLDDVNDYLLWMENYKINREYGSLKERTNALIEFIKFGAMHQDLEFIEIREKYFNIKREESYIDLNYVLDSFEEYYYKHEINFNKIDNHYIKNYIVNSEKKYNASTMIHKRVTLHKFLSYINEYSGDSVFIDILNNMKRYKAQKGHIYDSKKFDKELVNKILQFINDYIEDPAIFVSKPNKHSQGVAYKNTAMVLIMLGAGCRVSEAVSLRYSDIKDEGSSYRLNIVGGKGNKNRTTYIKKELFQKHYEYLLAQSKSEDEYLSQTLNGEKTKRENLFNFVKKMFIFLDEDKQGLHIFRHHFGSNFAETNGNMKILQDLLGHALINTTMIYSGVGEEAKRVAIGGI